jgi:hypothetical protein
MSGDMNQAPLHLASHPIAGAARDVNFSAGHLATQVAPHVAVDVNLAASHALADPMHSCQVARKFQSAGVSAAGNVKELGQRQCFIAVLNRSALDLGQRFANQFERQNALHLNGHRGLSVIF